MTALAGVTYRVRALHLAAVWALGVSQPVFSMLDANPEFLVVRGSTRFEVLSFAVVLAFGVPLLAVACEWALSRVSSLAPDILHLLFVGVGFALFGLQVAKSGELDVVSALVSAFAGAVIVVAAYVRWRAVQAFFTFLVVLPIGAFAGFVSGVPLAQDDIAAAHVTVPSRTPVVFLVLDEFPVSSLMTVDGRIDAVRYPSFGRLARESTWYPRATTVHEHTTGAVPALLTGSMPQPGDLPLLADHRQNLFTLLGETYDLHVQEAVTLLCPTRYCPRERGPVVGRLRSLAHDVRIAYLHRVLPPALSDGLPQIGDRWGGFSNRDELLAARDAADVDRVLAKPTDPTRRRFVDFLRGLAAERSDTSLQFFHLLLPHSPWRNLPSGREYGNAATIDGIMDAWNAWGDRLQLVEQGYQRHLLQVGYTDRLLGRFLRSLERSGLYEQALVVVVADHGVSFEANGTRRTVNADNLSDIARVPLFIKYPRQAAGRIDARAVQTIDVLPTVADVLDVALPEGVDGRSLLDTRSNSRTVVVSRRDGSLLRAAVSDVDRDMVTTLRRKSRLFGSGHDSLYEIGTNTDLLGAKVGRLQTRASSTARVSFDGEQLFSDVRTASSFVPARVTGTIGGVEIPASTELAIAVNGRIVALTRSFRFNGRQRFGAQVPETAFNDGDNEVMVLAIDGALPSRRLQVLGAGNAAERFVLSEVANEIVLSNGTRAVLESGRIAGRVETWRLDAGTARLRGWAADLREGRVPDRILVFAAGDLVFAGETGEYRWDVAETQGKAGLERSGFVIELPGRVLRGAQVRVVALRGATASELPVPSDFAWR